MALSGLGIAEPFIDSLPKPARAAFSFLRPLAVSGMSVSAAHRHLTSAGIAIGRGSVSKAFSAILGDTQGLSYIAHVRSDYLPDPMRLPTSKTNTLRRYSYQILMTGTHSQTGEVIHEHITVSSNKLISKSDALAIAEEMVLSSPSSYAIDAIDSTVTAIYRNPTMSI